MGPAEDLEGTIVVAGHLEAVAEEPEARRPLAIEVRVLGKAAERGGVGRGEGFAEGVAPGVGIGDAGRGQEPAQRGLAVGIARAGDAATDDGPGVEGDGRRHGDGAGPGGQPAADRLGIDGRQRQVQPGVAERLGERGIRLVIGDHATPDLLQTAHQLAIRLGRRGAAHDLRLQAVEPGAQCRGRAGIVQVVNSSQRGEGRLPLAGLAVGVFGGLIAQELGLPQGHFDPGPPDLALIEY